MTATDMPVVDEHDILRNGPRWIALGPLEARIARLLTRHPREVVTRAAIERAGWDDDCVRANTVDRQMHRLRIHMRAIGLVLHTIRGHGYVVEVAQRGEDGAAPMPASSRARSYTG